MRSELSGGIFAMLLPTRLSWLKEDILKDAHRLIFQVNAPMKAGLIGA